MVMATATASTDRISPSSPANSRQERPEKKAAPRRTTVALSPRAQEIVERFRSASGSSTSAAIDQIIQRSEPMPSRLKMSDIGLLVLDVPFRHVNVTLEDVKRAEDAMDRESIERLMLRKKSSVSKGSGTKDRQ
jgi:hypothetical protein